tara:strand:- start:3509 stop:5272 length:1764 start_codon:yes stop_codon:yes gene_type:complete
MLLITAEVDQSYIDNNKVLFLGEWCKPYSKKNLWNQDGFTTLTDCWSDRKNRQNAYNYTNSFYDECITIISTHLNDIHQTNYPDSYWKLLCGPWLKLLINSTYHSYCLIESAEDIYGNELKTFFFDNHFKDFIPLDMQDFETLIVSNSWNLWIKSLIASEAFQLKTCTHDIKICSHACKIGDEEYSKIKRFLLNCADYISGLINIKSKYIFYNPYIKKSTLIKLAARFLSVPKYLSHRKFFLKEKFSINIDIRETSLRINPRNKFEFFFKDFVLKNIPLVYLEGYEKLDSISKRVNTTVNPESIICATSQFNDDIFKIYAAKKISDGSKLKIISHGGFGQYLYSDFQDMDFEVCSDYFSWGWKEYSLKCNQGFLTKNLPIKSKKKTNSGFVHVLLDDHKHVKFIDSTPSYEQFINDYLNNQINFLNYLDIEIIRHGIIKLGTFKFNDSYQNSIEIRLKDAVNYKDLNFSYRDEDFHKKILNSRIVVCTYNGSNLIESMYLNKPTIIFWNPTHHELIESARLKYQPLIDAKIFHITPKSAAFHMNDIWNSPEDWWHSEEVVLAKNNFLEWFGRKSPNPTKELINFIKK